jgi:beta-glucosidase
MPQEHLIDVGLFPSDFVWGAAASAYQIEGAAREDGRGESIWDRFCAAPGKVRAGDTGDVACDFYHRYREDTELARGLGLGALRFSIAWPRILPEGRGRVNEAGLDFYDRVVDTLLAAGIRPFVTLYHWDLPQPLEDAGGWPARATAEAYVAYVEAVAARLGDRVTWWLTQNEPFCIAWLGYDWGLHAPGRRSLGDAVAAAHHVLLGHGWALDVLRRDSPRSEVGIALDLWPAHPASDDPADGDAARLYDASRNRWFLDPLFRGEYPVEALERFAPAVPPVRDGDLEAISAPIDFLGLNYYSRALVAAGPDGEPLHVRSPKGQLTAMGWEVYPDGIRELLVRLHREYVPRALYVTENGAAYDDVRGHDGRVQDVERIAYLADHVAAVGRSIVDGAPVRGYLVWSLLDNFEWSLGYSKRFGLVYVDYPTLTRVPKASYDWYRRLIVRHRA